jgi:hypothetical protein
MKKKFREGIDLIELNTCGFETYYPFNIISKESVTKNNRDNLLKVIRKEINEYFEMLNIPLRPIPMI